MRKLLLGPAAVLAVAGCQTTGAPAPIVFAGTSPTAAARPAPVHPPAANPYDFVPVATINGELFACNFSASNAGPLDERGASTAYTPWIMVPSGVLLRTPTQTVCLSSGYGYRGRAIGGGKAHSGIDLANANGGYIYAAADGRVLSVGYRGDYGLVVELDHGSGVRTIYAHLSETDPRLQPGAWATSGQAIARMGATGNATGTHLHYEVIINGQTVDPLLYGQPGPVS